MAFDLAFPGMWTLTDNLKVGRTTTSPADSIALTTNMNWSWSHDAAHRLIGAQLGAAQTGYESSGLAGSWSYNYGRADELASITTIKADGNEDIYRFNAGGSGRRR